MKPITDLLQITIQIPGFNYVVYFAAFYILFSAIKTAGNLVRGARWIAGKVFVKPSLWYAVFTGILTIFAVANTQTISDYLQYWETEYINPVMSGQYAAFSTSKKVSIYEVGLRANTMPDEYNTITDSIRAWISEFGMDSTAMYECAICECALNPFVVRTDGIAAGWIQFTVIGCDKMPFKMADVKEWCKDRNAERMMWATGQYLRYWAKGRRLKLGIDCYIAVFAPAHLGKPDETVLYGSGDAYRLNRGIDGFELANGMVVRRPGAVDGKITIQDLGYWMEYKNSQFIKSKLKFKN